MKARDYYFFYTVKTDARDNDTVVIRAQTSEQAVNALKQAFPREGRVRYRPDSTTPVSTTYRFSLPMELYDNQGAPVTLPEDNRFPAEFEVDLSFRLYGVNWVDRQKACRSTFLGYLIGNDQFDGKRYDALVPVIASTVDQIPRLADILMGNNTNIAEYVPLDEKWSNRMSIEWAEQIIDKMTVDALKDINVVANGNYMIAGIPTFKLFVALRQGAYPHHIRRGWMKEFDARLPHHPDPVSSGVEYIASRADFDSRETR